MFRMRVRKSLEVESSARGATETAYAALARRPLSELELRRKLLQRGFDASHVEEAVLRCREYGYLNDAELSKRQAAAIAKERRLGDFAVTRKLESRGFSRDNIEKAVGDLNNNADVPSEDLRAKEAVAKRFHGRENEREMRDKVIRFLRARGFDWEIIQGIIKGDE